MNRFGDSGKLNIGVSSVYKPHYKHWAVTMMLIADLLHQDDDSGGGGGGGAQCNDDADDFGWSSKDILISKKLVTLKRDLLHDDHCSGSPPWRISTGDDEQSTQSESNASINAAMVD